MTGLHTASPTGRKGGFHPYRSADVFFGWKFIATDITKGW